MSNSDQGDSATDSEINGDFRVRAEIALVMVGTAVTFVICFWRLFLYKARALGSDDIPSSCAGGSMTLHRDLSTLPTFVHSCGDGMESVECTVCLAELEDGERGRVLPECGHKFHVECIDMWFRSKSTCPLCRATAPPEQSITEASTMDSDDAPRILIVT